MRRRAFTFVEVMVAVALCGVLLAALLGLWRTGARVHEATVAAEMLSGALLVEESLYLGLRQMGLSAAHPEALAVSAGEVRYQQVSLTPTGVRFQPARFATTPSPGGNRLLARERPGAAPDTLAHVPLGELAFSLVTDPVSGERFVRTDFAVLESDRLPEPNHRRERRTLIVRVPGPAELRATRPAVARAARASGAVLPGLAIRLQRAGADGVAGVAFDPLDPQAGPALSVELLRVTAQGTAPVAARRSTPKQPALVALAPAGSWFSFPALSAAPGDRFIAVASAPDGRRAATGAFEVHP